MDNMKYIIVEGAYGYPTAYIFSDNVQHADMAQQVNKADKVLGAGFVTYGPDGLVCFGRSVSLDIKSRNEIDTKIINRELKGPDD